MMSKMTQKEIKAYLAQFPEQVLLEEMAPFVEDTRDGVQKVLASYRQKVDKYTKEQARVKGMWTFEEQFTQSPLRCGVDEVGRGPFAGPVVTAAVIMRDDEVLYINDSKQLSEERREQLYGQIIEHAVAYHVGIVDVATINAIGIKQATLLAMKQAIEGLAVQPDFILVDAETIPGISIPQRGIIKGDSLSYHIAAASILAKVTRDRMMDLYDELYPAYGFKHHKGYGTDEHRAALKQYGATPIHRTQFIRNHL